MGAHWGPWFNELAGRIAAMEPAEFVGKAKRIDWGDDASAALDRKYLPEDMDPFSFITYLAFRFGRGSVATIYPQVAQEFKVTATLPDPASKALPKLPKPDRRNMLFFHGTGDQRPSVRTDEQLAAIWRLLRQIVADEDYAESLQAVLGIKDVTKRKLDNLLITICQKP